MAVEQEPTVAGLAVGPLNGSEARSSNGAELRVVYLATAADTSCVSHDDSGHQHAVVSFSSMSQQHTVMDVDGSDSDIDDSTPCSVTGVTATMLQRN